MHKNKVMSTHDRVLLDMSTVLAFYHHMDAVHDKHDHTDLFIQ